MQKSKKSKPKLLHQYYKYTGFYSFIWESTKKAFLPILLFVGFILFINYKVINIKELLILATQNFNDLSIFALFTISESFLGLLPPDIFIAWTKSTSSPLLYLFLLAIISYLGGVFSYFFGKYLVHIPFVHNYMEKKMKKHIKNMRKWGGFLIAVGALLPLPFAMACLAAGMINFSKKHFFIFASLRFVRFALYGYVIYSSLS